MKLSVNVAPKYTALKKLIKPTFKTTALEVCVFKVDGTQVEVTEISTGQVDALAPQFIRR